MVEEISPEMRDTPIYKLTEALANKNLRDALVQLNRMRNETTLPRNGFARYVFNAICRNVYDLLRVREMASQRLSAADIASKLGMHPFVAEKNIKLSRNFQAARLDWLYHRLTELDYADKTGRADLTSELDLLMVEICAA
jgi:DNA polymerase-3 subunit delta